MTAPAEAEGSLDENGRSNRRSTLGASCGAHVVHDGVADALYVLLPIWASAFGLSYAASGLLKSAYSVALAALQMPAGMLAERIGERSLLTVGTLVAGAAFALAGLSQSYPVLLVMILLVGIGSSVQHPIGSSLIAKAYAAGSRRSALGVYNFSGDLGKMAAAALIGLGAATLGWRQVMFGYGLLVLGMGITVFVMLARAAGEIGTGKPKEPAKPAGGASAPGFGFTSAGGYALLSTIQVIDSAVRVAVLTLVPFLLIAKGSTSAAAGLALALLFAGGAAGKLACGLLADRLGILRTVIMTELLTAILIMAVIAAPLAVSMVLLPLLGIALNGTSSVLYGTVADFVRPDRQARAFGLFYSLGSAAGVASPVIFGLVSDWLGLTAALSIVAATVLLTLPLAAALRAPLARVT